MFKMRGGGRVKGFLNNVRNTAELALQGIPKGPLVRRWFRICYSVCMTPARFLKSSIAATVVGGPTTFGRTKKFNSRRSLGDQTTGGETKFRKQRGDKNGISILNWIRILTFRCLKSNISSRVFVGGG